jgi:hypothetical protein
MEKIKPEQFQERQFEITGWPVKLTTYRLGDTYVCPADDVSPGACLARISASTLEDAETQAIAKARYQLGKTRRFPV